MLHAEVKAVYNNASSLPDAKFISATGGLTVIAHSILLNSTSPAFKDNRMIAVRYLAA